MDIVCSECGSEPWDPETAVEDGWDLHGEFGERCPECVVLNAAPNPEGITAIANTVGAEKKEK